MTQAPLLFQSEAMARALVAGIPAAARAVAKLADSEAIAQGGNILLLVPGGWEKSDSLHDEIARLAPGIEPKFAAYAPSGDSKAFDGLEIMLRSGASKPRPVGAALGRSKRAGRKAIRTASKRVIAATGKPGDGLVSQWLNRPISRFISYHALKIPGIRPIHGTIAAAILGLVMAICLFAGGETGLMAGAVLFQLASIVDGVDGEIARATHRSSSRGATLDTATDAVTNIAFIAGVSANLAQQGEASAALAGFAGIALLATGLAVIGALSLRGGGPLSFDALKSQADASGSPLMAGLARIASRDVYALVLALLIIAGLAGPAMIGFAAAIAVWFFAAMAMLARG